MDFPFLHHPGPSRASASRLFSPAASGRVELGADNFVFLMKRSRTEQAAQRAGKGSAGICPCPSPRARGDLQPHPGCPHGLGGPNPSGSPKSPGQLQTDPWIVSGRGGGRERARPHQPMPGGAAGAALCPYKARLGSPGPIRAGMGTPEPGPAPGAEPAPVSGASPAREPLPAWHGAGAAAGGNSALGKVAPEAPRWPRWLGFKAGWHLSLPRSQPFSHGRWNGSLCVLRPSRC